MCNFGSSQSYAPTNQMTTQTTTASPQAQQMYNTAWQQAQSAAQRPFQQYSTDPNAFVAGLNPVQTGAISGLQSLSQAGQPYFGAAPGLTYGAGTTSAAGLAGAYMNPFMQQVAAPVLQQQGQQLAQQQAEAIKGGAFGGERAGLQRQALRGQQNLGLGQIYAGGYQQALGAAQTDLARQLQAGQALSPMGLQALQSTLQAGTLGQQTEQAGKQALYNQFLMQQAYPFQTSQFLTQAATGLGPGYGGTTQGYQQTQTPLSFWGNPLSDPNLKVGAEGDGEPEVIGETYDGQKIYRYRLINPDTGELGAPQIGLMADEAGERNPEAVGDYKGFKTLDYAAATDDAARMGGGVTGSGDYNRGGRTGYALEGGVDDLSDLLKSQQESFKGKETPKGLYGAVEAAPIQAAKIESPSLKFAEAPKGEGGTLSQGLQGLGSLVGAGKSLFDVGSGLMGSSSPTGVVGSSGDRSVPTFGKADSGIDWMDIGSSALKALPALASAAAMFSDPNLKTGVRPGYKTVGGVPVTTETEDETVDDDGFKEAVKETFKYEGGLNPNDVGRGPSMYGINQAAHPGMDVTKLSPAQAQDIYRKQYWEGVGAGKLDPQIREMVYDTAVLAGPRRAKQLLEVAGSDPEAYMAAREKFLGNLAKNDPQKFNENIQLSWANRNKELRERAGLGNADEVLANLPAGARDWSANTEGLKPTAGPEGLSGFLRGKPAEGLGEKALDFATSEKFLIPLLQGLGGMASSGSRFFAPSLLQGIGAGAKGYADLRQQEFERAKTAEALGLEAKKVGLSEKEIGLKEKELQRKMAVAKALAGDLSRTPYTTPTPTPSGVQPKIVAGGEDVVPSTDGKTQAPISETVQKTDFWKNVDPAYNPSLLNSKADELEQKARMAAAYGADEKDIAQLYTNAKQFRDLASGIMREGKVMDRSGTIVDIPGAVETARKTAEEQERAKFEAGRPSRMWELNKNYYEKLADEADTSREVAQKAQAAVDIMFDETGKPRIASGPLAPQISDFLAGLKQFGVTDENLAKLGKFAPIAATDPSAAQELRKVTNDMVGEVARQSLGGNKMFVSEFKNSMGSVPNETILPEAIKFISEKMLIPRAQRVIDRFDHATALDKEKEDIRKEVSKWEKENPFRIEREPGRGVSELDSLKAERERRKKAGLVGVRSGAQ